MSRSVLITGCARGIGRVMATYLARRGWDVVAGVRDVTGAEGLRADAAGLPVRVVALDVDSDAGVARGVADAIAAAGRLDALVNNAGIGLAGAVEEMTWDEIRLHFETNLFGALRTIRALLPHFRAHHGGRIVNISSIGGRMALPARTPYCASKYALEALSEGLRYELRAHRVWVSLIEPGAIDLSRFGPGPSRAAAAAVAADPASPYRHVHAAVRSFAAGAPPLGTPPEAVAAAVLRAMEAPRPSLRYVVGMDARLATYAQRLLPPPVFEWLMRRQYGL